MSTLAEAVAVSCTHCGLPVPEGLIERDAERQFCCTGCRTAYAIIHEHGLERYYALSERRSSPVQPSGSTFDAFDHPAFHALYVTKTPSGRSRVELYLERVHCAACVWLVERVPILLPGVARAELHVGRSLATIEWDETIVPLSAIARALDAIGYPAHPYRGVNRDAVRQKEDRAMLVRIGVAGAIAINVMLAALALYSGRGGAMDPEWERFFRWISFALVTPAMIWPGRVFFAGAISALRAGALNMDVPIALGLAAGYVRGAINTIIDSGPVYFDGLATLTFALLVGRYLQQRGQRAASDSTELTFSLTPSTARIIGSNGDVREAPSEAVVPGMMIEVRASDAFPADGTIESGASAVDRSLLTGESRPVRVGPGDDVFAGTVNTSARLAVRVTASGETSRIATIMREIETSSARRAPVVETAAKMAGTFVAVVLVLAAVTWVAWQFIDPSRAIDNAIALLVVTCPCALALSTPLAVSVAIGRAARSGILIKGGDALEQLSKPSQLILDKTGTITEACATVADWNGPSDVKPLVLALEAHSSHPIAGAFRASWGDSAADLVTHDVQYAPGLGIEGFVGKRHLVVGSPAFVAEHTGERMAVSGDDAYTQVAVAIDGEVVGRALIGDPVRADARASVDALVHKGWSVSILSGDASSVARSVGRTLGLEADRCIGDAAPETKRDRVVEAQRRGPVVMVGDGVNDAAAMAAATVGIGVHGGAEACLQTADVYLARPGLAPLVELVRGAERTMHVIRRNIAFSLAYNAAGAALAMTGVLSPLVAAILMPASSLTVVIASWRSRTFTGSAA